MADTTKPVCAGCIGCGGPDCIERPEPPAWPDWLLRVAAASAVAWALIAAYALWVLQ